MVALNYQFDVAFLYYQTPQVYGWNLSSGNPAFNASSGSYNGTFTIGTLDAANNVFPDITTAMNYYAGVYGATLTADVNTIYGTSFTPGIARWGISDSIGTLIEAVAAKQVRTVSTESRTIQTSTGAVGWQISATKDSTVRYSVGINTSVSLSGNSSGYVVLEMAPTNSATAGDWVECARVPSGQSGTLVVGLVLNQVGGGMLEANVPAGYYVKLRSVDVAGTPTYTYNSGQKTIYG